MTGNVPSSSDIPCVHTSFPSSARTGATHRLTFGVGEEVPSVVGWPWWTPSLDGGGCPSSRPRGPRVLYRPRLLRSVCRAPSQTLDRHVTPEGRLSLSEPTASPYSSRTMARLSGHVLSGSPVCGSGHGGWETTNRVATTTGGLCLPKEDTPLHDWWCFWGSLFVFNKKEPPSPVSTPGPVSTPYCPLSSRAWTGRGGTRRPRPPP